jgi:hypothetical protein
MTGNLFMDDFPIEALMKSDATTTWPQMQNPKFWGDAAFALKQYEPPTASLTIKHVDRKWELVSAYQKTVRRGDTELALRLVSAMCSLPAELPYFWKRVCTTATEDVGAGDKDVMNFVVTCSMIYLPKKAADYQYKILCFLTEMMCETTRSRAYCSMSIIEGMLKAGVKPAMDQQEKDLCNAIMGVQEKEGWAKKNNWRGETMLIFQLADYELKLANNFWKRPAPLMLKGLPNYAYDMHTRSGKMALGGVAAKYAPVVEFFAACPTLQNKAEVVGWAILFEEGLKIDEEELDIPLAYLEQKFIAAKFGWKFDKWMDFREIVRVALEKGEIDSFREWALSKQEY